MKVEFYKLLSIISVLFFATSMVLSTIAIKSEMPWINQRINEFKLLEKFNLNIIHKYDLKIEYTLTHMIGYALDKSDNEKSYYLGKCSYVDNLNNETCAGPYNEKTPKIVATIYYINLSFITFLFIMFIVELNYLLFSFVTRNSQIGKMHVTRSFSNFNEILSLENDTVTIKVKFGSFIMIFRFLYTCGTILMYISAYLFVFQFPKLIQKQSIENSSSTLFVENGITLTFINCILTTIGSILIIVAFYLFNYKLKEIKKKKKLNNQINFLRNDNNKFIISDINNKYSLLDDENL
ncbi:hypothetical protein ACTA71_008116 [Dictyostelium dimigraforme]